MQNRLKTNSEVTTSKLENQLNAQWGNYTQMQQNRLNAWQWGNCQQSCRIDCLLNDLFTTNSNPRMSTTQTDRTNIQSSHNRQTGFEPLGSSSVTCRDRIVHGRFTFCEGPELRISNSKNSNSANNGKFESRCRGEAQTGGVPEFVDLRDLFWTRSPSKHTEKGVPIVNLASAAARTWQFALNWQTSATAEPLSWNQMHAYESRQLPRSQLLILGMSNDMTTPKQK